MTLLLKLLKSFRISEYINISNGHLIVKNDLEATCLFNYRYLYSKMITS